ncbi:hypothetical protein H1R17_02325 [Flavobacterium sp. xlx-214]|uniref:hypothetical protein n=1 Tax=unclassified Flavobacterium TaxID=196869 RepID=UPI0013D6D789|nr:MULTISPECIES: hypothetical protein [unclassified Flavobacterium]MBA5794086.1 hypothetical protein [Flavobacterium sp. xlx-221]QMI83995.1 hypothetical protein H1R17_02325 [Flavobacterium sp. xlx-214]
MKKITYTIGFAFAMLATSNAVAQQGFGTNRPDKSAAVEIKSPNKGLLIPRITLTSDTDVTTIVSPANSLLIYNETTTNGLHAGYYYFNTNLTKWIPLLDSQYQNNTTVTQDGQNLSVIGTPTVNANGSTTTDYKVKITPGLDKQFLATYDDNGTLKTKWVSYGDIIEVTNGLTKTGNTIKLGGTLTEDTTLNTNGKKVMIQGLSQVPNMDNQVIAVGHETTGEVKVATPKQIVDKGLTHDLTSSVNTMKSTINGVDKTAPIINTNDLSIAANTTILTSTVNGVADTQDLKPTIQSGQIKYDVTAGTGVTIDPTGSTADFKTFKISADAGAIALDGDVTGPANNNKVVKIQNVAVSPTVPSTGQVLKEVSGVWTPSTLKTTDVTDGKKLSSTDLVISDVNNKALLQDLTVDIKNDAVKAVKLNDDTAGAGLVRNATTKALDVNAKNGVKVDAADDFVKLGGALTEATTITTTANETLAIAGLQPFTGAQKNVVVVDANGVLKTAAINTSNAIVTTAASLSLTDTHETILVNASAGSVTVTLPTAADDNKGKRYYVKLVATNTANTNEVIISSASAIDGATTPIASSSPYQAWLLQSDGTAWFVVGN